MVGLATIFVAGVRGGLWIRAAKNGGQASNPGDARASIESQVNTERSLEQITTQMTTMATVLNSTAITLAKISERLEHLPTIESVKDLAKDIRHKIDNQTTAIVGEIQLAVSPPKRKRG